MPARVAAKRSRRMRSAWVGISALCPRLTLQMWRARVDLAQHVVAGRVWRQAMRCPWCGHDQDKVVDSRSAESGSAIRRRRQCIFCGRRFTTFERTEAIGVTVVKRDGAKEPFDREKVMAGVRKAIKNRPGAEEPGAAPGERVGAELRRKGRRVTPQGVGLEVRGWLRVVEGVACVGWGSAL